MSPIQLTGQATQTLTEHTYCTNCWRDAQVILYLYQATARQCNKKAANLTTTNTTVFMYFGNNVKQLCWKLAILTLTLCMADHLFTFSSTLWRPLLRNVTQSGSLFRTLEALLMAPTMVLLHSHGLFKHRPLQCSKITCSTFVCHILRVSRWVFNVAHVSNLPPTHTSTCTQDATQCLSKIHSPALPQLWWTRAVSLLDLFWTRKGKC